ncbi:MAG TPA: molybdopterin-dependent oxidoreductase [Capillimicrobium sp.]|nr:molybdopterin-dependent oxidoreductase [Capillimicrobium sp.]
MRTPPGPFRPTFWRSPLRGPWLTTLLGALLLPGVVVVAVTGFLSEAAYEPSLGGNAIVPVALPLTFGWPTSPPWLYALTQGLHVNAGLAVVPLLLAKLWSVVPKLFAWPPARSPAALVERLSIALLVGSALFELVTGVTNMQNWYPWGFNFVVAHYYGAVVFVAALVAHVVVKLPTMRRAWRDRPGTPPAHAAEPTITRRGLLGLVGAGSAAVLLANVGETIGGPLRATALLAPRRATRPGPNGFPVNKTAAAARVDPALTGPGWRLLLVHGDARRELSRDELLALDQRTETLPIACVEGWTTTQEWEGVPLAALAELVGAGDAGDVLVESLQPRGVLRAATLSHRQFSAEPSLLALRVNGVDLSLDHGFPARIVVPALPGVHATKWVSTMTFAA